MSRSTPQQTFTRKDAGSVDAMNARLAQKTHPILPNDISQTQDVGNAIPTLIASPLVPPAPSAEDRIVQALQLDENHDGKPRIAISLPHLPPDTQLPNILIFGETGIGKSSLINMISGADIAGVSGDALGFTFGSTGYEVIVDHTPVRLWDTAGLNEGERGAVPAEQALKNLQDLVHGLQDGVSLLVYVVRGTRFRDILEANYEMFSKIICQAAVPVVVIITGLEHEDPMESWWTVNGHEFDKRGLHVAGHACVTTIKGKKLGSGGFMFEDEYEQSEEEVRKLILAHRLQKPWTMNKKKWLKKISTDMAKYYLAQARKQEQAALDLQRELGSAPQTSRSAGGNTSRATGTGNRRQQESATMTDSPGAKSNLPAESDSSVKGSWFKKFW